IDIEQAGDNLAAGLGRLQVGDGPHAVGGIVAVGELVQPQDRVVVLGDLDGFTGGVVHVDRLAADNDVQPVHRLVVLAHEVVALGRSGVVVELHAGADGVDEGRALVGQGRLDEWYELSLVAGEGAGDEGRAQLQGDRDEVDGAVVVDHAALGLRAFVRGGRELALGQAVHAVVLDDVGHVHSTPDGVGELAEADRGGIPVAGDAQVDQLAVGQVRPGQHRGHAPV